jgi:hypothetical protein
MPHTHVILALLPNDAIDDEHMTLVYAGQTDQLVSAPLETMQEVCRRLATIFAPFPAWVTGMDAFGADSDVPVATIDSAQIHQLRACVEHFHNSQYGLRPHITALPGRPPRAPGSTFMFDRLALWYGDHREEFRLGTNYPLHGIGQRPLNSMV